LPQLTSTERRPPGSALLVLGLALLAVAVFSPPARAAAPEYGFQSASANLSSSQAGSHPDLSLSFGLTTGPDGAPAAATRSVSVSLPAGLVADPTVIPRCSEGELSDIDIADPSSSCPVASQVGTVAIEAIAGESISLLEPLYNLSASHAGTVARFGFIAGFYPEMIDVRLSQEDHRLTATLEGATSAILLTSATMTLWGVPADPSHDTERITPYEALHGGVPGTPTGRRSSGLPLLPFTANPTRCGESMLVRFAATNYTTPQHQITTTADLPSTTGCGMLHFSPGASASIDSPAAAGVSGVSLRFFTPEVGFDQPGVLLGAAIRTAIVQFPAGFALNPSFAGQLEACSPGQIALGLDAQADCPTGSKMASAEASTPLLAGHLQGGVYIATPFDNPFDSLFTAYVVLAGEGAEVKIPIRFEADPIDGRLTAEVSEIPPLPFSELALRFPDGPRAMLENPSACGTYPLTYRFGSWSGQAPIKGSGNLSVSSSCTRVDFHPRFSAGTIVPRAGVASPLVVDLSRGDREADLARLALTLPPGLGVDLAAVPPCPEQLTPTASCPPASRVGSTRIALGAGPEPLWIPAAGGAEGAVYLAGPYEGAAFSLLISVPATAGPFDLGRVVLRAPVRVDPESGQISAELADLPQIRDGIPLHYRAVHLVLDRPGFVRNPTSCEPLAIRGISTTSLGQQALLSSRFQVGDCNVLAFKPKLRLRFGGAIGRNGHPSVTAVVGSREGDANLRHAAVLLPRGVYLDQTHIRGVCTRSEFDAGRCPADSVYGQLKAWTPLLDKPLSGAVYLREGPHRLPDLAADLAGQVHIVLDGRLVTPHGQVRAGFVGLPDLPFNRLAVTLRGGRRGLFVDSENVCSHRLRATGVLTGQNGKRFSSRPRVTAACPGTKRERGVR
jgi:hypothetical protein